MNTQHTTIEKLCRAVETTVGKKMHTPKDFDTLSEIIFDKLHQNISPSTLKRIWGYLPSSITPRLSSIDLLAQFVGYDDFDAFAQQEQTAETIGPSIEAKKAQPHQLTDKSTRRFTNLKTKAVVISILCSFLLGAGATFLITRTNQPTTSKHIIHKGQIFHSYHDYLRLFGITQPEHFWDCPLPHHEGIFIWGPEYQHPNWHNDGVRDSLMPTITEWWTPTDNPDDVKQPAISEAERQRLIAERNEQLYYYAIRTNEVRITFMKNLIDTGYVFLGIYRVNLTQSDSTHIVWERMADECSLNNLDFLEQLRN